MDFYVAPQTDSIRYTRIGIVERVHVQNAYAQTVWLSSGKYNTMERREREMQSIRVYCIDTSATRITSTIYHFVPASTQFIHSIFVCVCVSFHLNTYVKGQGLPRITGSAKKNEINRN